MSAASAIETRYKGHRFRSRLEARWAVFFDALGLRWEHEKQGYALPSGPYLPDFWLPSLRCWVEIKGEAPTDREKALAEELVLATGCNVFVIHGSLPGYSDPDDDSPDDDRVDAYLALTGEDGRPCCGWDNYYRFCVCLKCKGVGIEFTGRSDRLDCKECTRCQGTRLGRDVTNYPPCPRVGGCGGRCRRTEHGDHGNTDNHPRILAAIARARSARFEHGETQRDTF